MAPRTSQETASSPSPSTPPQVKTMPPTRNKSSGHVAVFNALSLLIWPSMLLVPLLLNAQGWNTHYSKVFPAEWYIVEDDYSPKPLGLSLGIFAVFVGQVFVLIYHFVRLQMFQFEMDNKSATHIPPVQKSGAPQYNYATGMLTHLAQPEGFGLLVLYLSGTWMYSLMPASYYSFEGGIDYFQLALCLACQDGVQYLMHRLEHVVSPELYRRSHKPHHR
uniref:Fatty acid hydroxylase domain-containing protein n=1 Tax=Leptocylindrus danicus TaxID=163516 RepID=A0A7S2NR03_9STRA|eukprot:CAMPEP_0116037612 /NCGR_PEP_ID=MMETSP0321-20121206/22183_1 /TAXON_ID=163516 /ORGANISM="Leptocylindrus danicus var. danicus, Strain B650" /LENGTH=218 /DNA_ID=CAMNT_0003515901 /DNA_START=11 /DNA_END=667 /DNA_ORIENTATION=+